MGIIKANIIDIANMLHNNKNVNHFSFIFLNFAWKGNKELKQSVI